MYRDERLILLKDCYDRGIVCFKCRKDLDEAVPVKKFSCLKKCFGADYFYTKLKSNFEKRTIRFAAGISIDDDNSSSEDEQQARKKQHVEVEQQIITNVEITPVVPQTNIQSEDFTSSSNILQSPIKRQKNDELGNYDVSKVAIVFNDNADIRNSNASIVVGILVSQPRKKNIEYYNNKNSSNNVDEIILGRISKSANDENNRSNVNKNVASSRAAPESNSPIISPPLLPPPPKSAYRPLEMYETLVSPKCSCNHIDCPWAVHHDLKMQETLNDRLKKLPSGSGTLFDCNGGGQKFNCSNKLSTYCCSSRLIVKICLTYTNYLALPT